MVDKPGKVTERYEILRVRSIRVGVITGITVHDVLIVGDDDTPVLAMNGLRLKKYGASSGRSTLHIRAMRAELMQEINVDFGLGSPKLLCVTAPVQAFELDHVQPADPDEVAKFATRKRVDEHLSGRLLLRNMPYNRALTHHYSRLGGTNLGSALYICLELGLDNPYHQFQLGIPMGELCCIDTIDGLLIDGEPVDLEISDGVFDMMASGDELTYLRDNPADSVRLWTAKEAIQKAARKGMHLNPRKIKIPIGINESNITIGKSIFQLRNLVQLSDFNISIAICPGIGYDSIQEDDLLQTV